jgi:hypothetical protein
MSPGAWNPAAGRVEVQLTPHTLDGLRESGHIAAGIVPDGLGTLSPARGRGAGLGRAAKDRFEHPWMRT